MLTLFLLANVYWAIMWCGAARMPVLCVTTRTNTNKCRKNERANVPNLISLYKANEILLLSLLLFVVVLLSFIVFFFFDGLFAKKKKKKV